MRLAHASIKEGYPLNSSYFFAIGLYSEQTLADRYKHATYHNKHWWRAF